MGEVETEDGVLVIRRIYVRLNLKARGEDREVADRVHGFYKDSCPIYRSLRAAIDITTDLSFESLD